MQQDILEVGETTLASVKELSANLQKHLDLVGKAMPAVPSAASAARHAYAYTASATLAAAAVSFSASASLIPPARACVRRGRELKGARFSAPSKGGRAARAPR